MHKFGLILIGAVCLTAGAAMSAHAGEGALLGTGIGAALGGLAGSQFGHGAGQVAAAGIGVAAGAAIGNSVGRSMDYADASYGNDGAQLFGGSDMFPAGVAFGGYQANYVAPPAPSPIYADEQAGTYCRQYSQRIRIDGQWQESYGTACLQPDGIWRIVQ